MPAKHRIRQTPWSRSRAAPAAHAILAFSAALLAAARPPVDSLPLKASDAYEGTRALLSKQFREYESDHYIVLSDAGAAWSRDQLRRLERTWEEFEAYAARLDLRPDPIRHKLVAVLFAERRRYAEFGRTHDRVHADWSFGYYAPAHDRLVLFDGESEPGADEFARPRTIATTVHEAIHQLHYHTGIQNKHVQYPLWSCEGLATSFETADIDRAFGPEYEFAPRRERFDRLLSDDSLIPLRNLVALDGLTGQNREVVAKVYNESYALLGWLARARASQLRDYFELMRRQPPGRPAAEAHLELFVRCFGQPEEVERQWLRDEVASTDRADVDPALLKRLKVSADDLDGSIRLSESRQRDQAEERSDVAGTRMDDHGLLRAAGGVQHLPGLPGDQTARR